MTPPYKTSERLPTKADANGLGYVLAFHTSLGDWLRADWHSVVADPEYSHWQPLPPHPISAEDAAFNAAVKEWNANVSDDLHARELHFFQAGIAFAKSSK